jgi:transcriptional regulator GlxA family with amidase domain
MRRCFDLLSHTEMGIAEVAEACGFRSVQYLSTVFKREIGATPAAWRHEHRERGAPSRDQTHLAAIPPR